MNSGGILDDLINEANQRVWIIPVFLDNHGAKLLLNVVKKGVKVKYSQQVKPTIKFLKD